MTEHFLLPEPSRVGLRRMGPGFGRTPARNPRRHGVELGEQLASAVPPQPLRIADGVDPRFVFKLRSDSGFTESILEGRELHLLAEGRESTYFVLAEDGGEAFTAALTAYAKGDDVEGASGPLKSLYNNIDAISPYGPEDRRGPGMNDLPVDGTVILDLTLWPSEDRAEALERVELLRLVLQEEDAEEIASTVSARLSIVRCVIHRAKVDALLGLYVVQTIRTPPLPYIDPSDWREIDADSIEIEWQESAPIGVLDDLPDVNHPVLTGHVRVSNAPIADGVSWASPSHHGTLVSGLALGRSFAKTVRDGEPIQLSGGVAVARVLESDSDRGSDATRFPPSLLPTALVSESIRHLHREGVRVFNLSFGYATDFRASHVGDLSEELDNLARELDVVIVVAAGNAALPISRTGPLFDVIDDYPAYVDREGHALAQPANAANLITVGGIAPSDAPWLRDRSQIGTKAVAGIGEISPFSRTGPGFGKKSKRMNKPDFVEFAGNAVVDDTGTVSLRDQGSGVLSTASLASGPFFQMTHGTSFASPVVAADAAAVLHRYPESSSNLIRALLASSAQPTIAGSLVKEEHTRHNRYGFGTVRRDDALDSSPLRATMTYDGTLSVDSTVLHPIPIPTDFALPRSATRRIRVALAFDPPVRGTRREYTAATMSLDIYRSVTLEELEDRLRRQDPDNPRPLFDGKRRLATQFRPSMTAWSESTLQVREWAPTSMDPDDGDTYYLAVTHKARTWFRDRDDYTHQRYAVAVSLEDQGRVELDLETMLTQEITVPAKVRGRART